MSIDKSHLSRYDDFRLKTHSHGFWMACILIGGYAPYFYGFFAPTGEAFILRQNTPASARLSVCAAFRGADGAPISICRLVRQRRQIRFVERGGAIECQIVQVALLRGSQL